MDSTATRKLAPYEFNDAKAYSASVTYSRSRTSILAANYETGLVATASP